MAAMSSVGQTVTQKPHVPTLMYAVVAAVVLIGLYHIARKR